MHNNYSVISYLLLRRYALTVINTCYRSTEYYTKYEYLSMQTKNFENLIEIFLLFEIFYHIFPLSLRENNKENFYQKFYLQNYLKVT